MRFQLFFFFNLLVPTNVIAVRPLRLQMSRRESKFQISLLRKEIWN